MSKICKICGKGPVAGRSISRKGLAKKKGGVGQNVTGVTKRRFLPNLQTAKVNLEGKVQKIKICTSCLKANKIEKVS